jgi:hypothetical protein
MVGCCCQASNRERFGHRLFGIENSPAQTTLRHRAPLYFAQIYYLGLMPENLYLNGGHLCDMPNLMTACASKISRRATRDNIGPCVLRRCLFRFYGATVPAYCIITVSSRRPKHSSDDPLSPTNNGPSFSAKLSRDTSTATRWP